MKLFAALHVVDNNGPDSIGGGGTPRVPLAPPFADTANHSSLLQTDRSPQLGSTSFETTSGNNGDGVFQGGDRHDFLNGGDSDDSIVGGNGNDHLFGEGGDDSVRGEDGDDYLDGGEGNDSLSGDGGDDFFSGWDGDDVLNGGSGVRHGRRIHQRKFCLDRQSLARTGLR